MSDDVEKISDKRLVSGNHLYSPGILAAYCLFTNLFIGIILYGINISRRSYLWRGRVLIILSGLVLLSKLILDDPTPVRLRFLLNALVALNLYKIEKPRFQRALRHGYRQAKWWLPLIWIGVAVIMLIILRN